MSADYSDYINDDDRILNSEDTFIAVAVAQGLVHCARCHNPLPCFGWVSESCEDAICTSCKEALS